MISATSSSVSRQAVPLPIATTPTWCLPTMSLSATLASDRRFWGGCGIDHGLVDQLAAGVEHGDLAAVLEPGIDGQHDLLGDRRLEQQAAQVAGEDLDGVLLGGLGQVATDLALHAGQDQPIERVDGGGMEQVVLGMALQRELAEQRGLHVGPGDLELDLQRAFLVAAVDRQHAVGRDLRDRLGVFEVIAVFQALALGDLRLAGDDLAGLPDDLADGVADHGHLADRLGEDVADPLQDLLDRVDALLGVDEFLRRRRRTSVSVSSRVQIRRARGSSPRSRASDALVRFLGLNGQVQVFEPLGVVGGADRRGEVGVQLPLRLDRLEDRLLPLGQLAQPLHAELDLADDHLVEVARPFLAVSRDERDGVPLVEELDDALHLHAPDLQVLRDSPQVDRDGVVHGDSSLHLVSFGRR